MVKPTSGHFCLKERSFDSQFSRDGRHGTSCGATWGSTSIGQEVEKLRGKHGAKPIMWISGGRGNRMMGLRLANLKIFSRLWCIEAALVV